MVFTSNDAKVLMPRNLADGIITQTASTSTAARLSEAEPQRFGETDYVVFNDFPKAEFVGEGAPKSSTRGSFSSVTAKPRKAQVTMRFSEEVQWADEDHQLGVFDQLSKAGAIALSRALDLGMYHRINPLSGEVITAWDNYVGGTTKRVTLGEGVEADQAFKAAVGLLVTDTPSVDITGAAFDPKFAWALANLPAYNLLSADSATGISTGVARYPNLGFGTDITSFLGVKTAQGNTVSGMPEAVADTGVRAIVGDFRNGIRWGVQRELPVELIRHGDPDGQGDLKRHNQIALRLEIVYGWYVFANRFAVIEAEVE
jgi:hypothetical protein